MPHLRYDDGMVYPSKGLRVKYTVRIPYDVHRQAQVHATDKGWPLSDYVARAVAEAVKRDNQNARKRSTP